MATSSIFTTPSYASERSAAALARAIESSRAAQSSVPTRRVVVREAKSPSEISALLKRVR